MWWGIIYLDNFLKFTKQNARIKTKSNSGKAVFTHAEHGGPVSVKIAHISCYFFDFENITTF